MNNREVAAVFENVADMLAIRGDHIHRVLAYRRAAENIRELNRDLNKIHAGFFMNLTNQIPISHIRRDKARQH